VSNFLHVIVPALGIELVGLRVPAYANRGYLDAYWKRLIAVIASARTRTILFIGDFNADPDSTYHIGAKQFAELRETGWLLPSPAGMHSFKSGTRIDHVVASSSFSPLHASYVDAISNIPLCGAAKVAVSDHAPIVVEFEPKSSVS
jgi:endonuclease/exonuclease/phosphatase family metal-dependent hydrolase